MDVLGPAGPRPAAEQERVEDRGVDRVDRARRQVDGIAVAGRVVGLGVVAEGQRREQDQLGGRAGVQARALGEARRASRGPSSRRRRPRRRPPGPRSSTSPSVVCAFGGDGEQGMASGTAGSPPARSRRRPAAGMSSQATASSVTRRHQPPGRARRRRRSGRGNRRSPVVGHGHEQLLRGAPFRGGLVGGRSLGGPVNGRRRTDGSGGHPGSRPEGRSQLRVSVGLAPTSPAPASRPGPPATSESRQPLRARTYRGEATARQPRRPRHASAPGDQRSPQRRGTP